MEVWFADHDIDQPSHWSQTWSEADVDRSVAALRGGRDPVHGLVRRLVRGMSTGHALEHGCGFGRVAVLLRDMGWRVDGIDFAMRGLVSARRLGTPVVCGDVRALPVRSGTYDCAVSVGTVEHLREGPGQALRELKRVLRPGGRAMVSVPLENLLRRARGRIGSRPMRRHGLSVRRMHGGTSDAPGFYQYSFRVGEFGQELSRAGFRLEETRPYSVFRGLADQAAGGRALRILQRRFGVGAAHPLSGDPVGASRGAGSANELRGRLVAYARTAYDETDGTVLARITRAGLGPVSGHMMAYFVRA